MDYILAHRSRLLIDFRDRLILSTRLAQAYLGLGAEVERVPVASDLCILVLNDLPSTHSQIDLRARLASLDQVDYRRISRAQQLLSWRAQHRFCGVCAQSLQLVTDDLSLFCSHCTSRLYPRISPCIIVLIENENRILLAHHARYEENRFSTLAGFIEAGETAEHAVTREIKEEVGVDVGELRYFKSQAWPFPDSLMLGYFAQYAAGEIIPDGIEIREARWFTVDELETVTLPPEFSISRQLINHWVLRQRTI